MPAREDGVVAELVADAIGTAAMWLGAGRATKESTIDLAVGLILHKKVDDKVKAGEALATIHTNNPNVKAVMEKLYENIHLAEQAEAPVLVYEIITE